MFKRGLCLLSVFLLSFCLCFGFLITCRGVNVFAVDYSVWSYNDTMDFYGRTIPFKYTLGGTTYNSEFHQRDIYDSRNYLNGLNIVDNSVITAADYPRFIVYSTNSLSISSSSLVSIDIPLDIYFTGGFRAAFGSCLNFSSVTDSKNLISSYPDNIFGLSPALTANPAADSSLANYYNFGTISFRSNTGTYTDKPFRVLTYDGVDNAIASARFQGVSAFSDGQFYLFVFCPSTYGDVSHDPPVTTTAPSGSGDVNVNVDVDLTETNGLLDSILAALRGLADSILDGLKGLFIPDDDFMDQFKIDMEDLAQDHLGGLYQAEQLLVDMFEDFDQVTAKNEIYIPAAHIPLAGADLVLGDWHVPLKVTGLPVILYDGIAFIIDFLALMAFLSMCRRKLEIFLVPESEAIKE